MATQTGAVRSAGYRRLHGFLCAAAALILLCCINTTLMGRELIRGGIAAGMQSSRLSDASLPFGDTLTENIRQDYVKDEKVTAEDIADAIDTMGIPYFLSGKLSNYGRILSGAADAPVHITGDEIVGLLEDSEDALYDKCLLVIEDSDKAEIRNSADGPLNVLNGISDFLYGNQFGRKLAHFRMSVWRLILDIVLLMLLVIRWAIVRENSGGDRPGAMKGMGRVFIIPSAIVLAVLVFFGAGSLFVKDGVIGLHPLGKALRAPLWAPVIFELAVGFFMTSFAKYLRSDARQKKLAEKQASGGQSSRRRSGGGQAPASAPVRRFCVSCGKELRPGAAFCIYCGVRQGGQTPEPAAPAPAPAGPAPAPAPAAPAPAEPAPAPAEPAPAPVPAAPAPSASAPTEPAPAAPAPTDADRTPKSE